MNNFEKIIRLVLAFFIMWFVLGTAYFEWNHDSLTSPQVVKYVIAHPVKTLLFQE